MAGLRVLWLCGDSPEPSRSGLHAYSRGLIRALAAAGAEVRCMGLGSSSDPVDTPPDGMVWERVVARRRRRHVSVFSRLPAMAHGFAVRPYRVALAGAANERWDAVVLDHLETGWALPIVGTLQGRPLLVHVSHNFETAVRAEVAWAARGALARFALRWDARKVARLERDIIRAADLITAITDEDARAFLAAGANRVVTLTPGYDGPLVERRITGDLPRRALLLGNFEWHVKDANLAEFLAVADPEFEAASAELRVVGPVGARVRTMRRRLRATTFTGWVPSVTDELASARLGIVAEPVGGGFKMKTLDMIFGGVPVAAVTGTTNGLPLKAGESLFVFDDLNALADGAARLVDDIERLDVVQRAAQLACRDAFDWTDRGRRLLAAIAATPAEP